jgi:hypothetical protein
LEEEGVGGYKLMEEEIDELLEKVSLTSWSCASFRFLQYSCVLAQLSSTLDSLTALLNSPDVPPSSSMMHAAARHRDIYEDYRREFTRTRVTKTRIRYSLLILTSSLVPVKYRTSTTATRPPRLNTERHQVSPDSCTSSSAPPNDQPPSSFPPAHTNNHYHHKQTHSSRNAAESIPRTV